MIRKITPDGVVTTLAGDAGHDGTVDGIGSGARFSMPQGMAVDFAGNVYVADGDGGNEKNTIRKITPEGVVTTLASIAAQASSATWRVYLFSYTQGLAVDGAGNVYVSGADNTIR